MWIWVCVCGLRRCECICGCAWQWGQNSTVKKKRRNSPPSQYASCRNLPLPSPPRSQMSFHMFQRGQLFLPHPAMMDSLLFLTGLCTHLLWTLQCFVTLGWNSVSPPRWRTLWQWLFSHVTHSQVPVHSFPQLTCCETPAEAREMLTWSPHQWGAGGGGWKAGLSLREEGFFSRVCRHLRERLCPGSKILDNTLHQQSRPLLFY